MTRADEEANEQPDNRDKSDMERMGKTQQTRRTFGLISMLGFTTIMLCSWESVYPFFLTSFINGGGITLIYGYIFCWLGSLATCASLAEIASMYPTSGGQYHWAALLAPPKYSNFLSWLTGWVSVLGWQAGATSGTFLGGTIIQGLLKLNDPTYDYKKWHGTLLLYAVLALSLFVNTVGIKVMPHMESLILVLHILGFFAILIPLVHLAPMSSAHFVFAEFRVESGYPAILSFFVGLSPNALLFVGYDGAAHMSEEVKNASMNVPRSMFFTIFLNGALGLGSCIALLFSIGDIDAALATSTGWPFIEIFYNATNSKAITTVMTSVLAVLIICATFGYVAAASRQLWAFARDRGVPFHGRISKVNDRFSIPLYAIAVSALIDALLGLINIGSTVAFNAIISLIGAGLFSSYLITIGLVIRKRLLAEPIQYGPWAMGSWGLPVNVFAFAYTLVVMVFSFFPPALPVTAETMNWSCVVFGGVVISGLVHYAVFGRHQYQGPVIDRQIVRQRSPGAGGADQRPNVGGRRVIGFISSQNKPHQS